MATGVRTERPPVALIALLAVTAAAVVIPSIGMTDEERALEFLRAHAPSNLEIVEDKPLVKPEDQAEFDELCSKADNPKVQANLRKLRREIQEIEPGVPSEDILHDTLILTTYATITYLCPH